LADVREDILVRLHEILATIPNIRVAQRNNPDLTEDQLPAAILFDGDEDTDDQSDQSMRPPNRPTMVSMMPAIVLAQQSNEAGSDLTTLRRELLKRVLTDTALNETIVKTGRNGNGAIRYLGCQTDFGEGRSLTGGLLARFMFRYVLKPDEL
jgi:hypothetical protein